MLPYARESNRSLFGGSRDGQLGSGWKENTCILSSFMGWPYVVRTAFKGDITVQFFNCHMDGASSSSFGHSRGVFPNVFVDFVHVY